MSDRGYTYQRKPSNPNRPFHPRTVKKSGPREGRLEKGLTEERAEDAKLDEEVTLDPFSRSGKTPRSPKEKPSSSKDPQVETPVRSRDSGLPTSFLHEGSFTQYRTPTQEAESDTSTSSDDPVEDSFTESATVSEETVEINPIAGVVEPARNPIIEVEEPAAKEGYEAEVNEGGNNDDEDDSSSEESEGETH